MGRKSYRDEEIILHPFLEFTGNFVCTFLCITSHIGGWLVYFGMNPWWMLVISAAIAGGFTIRMY